MVFLYTKANHLTQFWTKYYDLYQWKKNFAKYLNNFANNVHKKPNNLTNM